MKHFLNVRWIFGLLGAFVLTACSWVALDQVSCAKFSDLEEAVLADAVAKGWVPDFLPKSTHDIFEWHNVEQDKTRVEFSFDVQQDVDWIKLLFEPILNERKVALMDEVLFSREASIQRKGHTEFFELSSRKGERGFLFINYTQGRAQFWSEPYK